MTVSVVLPFRNAETTLAKAIQSILDQTFTNFELILVDNDSSDRSNEIARSFADSRIRLLIESKVGVVHAANRGMEESKGKLIARMDADDWSFPDRLEHQVSFLNENPDLGLVSGLIDSMKQPTEGFQKYLNWVNHVRQPKEIYLNQFVEYPIVNPSVMFRRELFEQHGGYTSGEFPEDYEYFLRLIKAGVKMQKVDQAVLQWNDLPSRLTRTSSNYSEQAFNSVKSQYLADWLRIHNSHHPEIWVWGAGKQARQKSQELQNHGVMIKGYIDVSDKEQSGDLPVVHFDEIHKPDRFIVSYVSNWGAREEIRTYLSKLDWEEGSHFILAG